MSSPSFPTDSVIAAEKDSLPFSLPSATAFCTAFSIASWELTPTVFRNLRMLMFSVSSFIAILLQDRLESGHRGHREIQEAPPPYPSPSGGGEIIVPSPSGGRLG